MGILDRVSRVVRANLNDLLSQAEDPAKLLDQHILDMQDAVRDARKRTAQVVAREKRSAGRASELKVQADRWFSRAEEALRAGDEALARRALATKFGIERDIAEMERQIGVQAEYTRTLRVSLEALQARLVQAKERRKQIAVDLARKEMADALARKQVRARAVDTSALDSSAAFDDFDRVAGSVEMNDLEAEAMRELNAEMFDTEDADLERRFEELSSARQTDDDLADLKRKLDGGK